MRLYDAHNHLQDERFGGQTCELLADCDRERVARMVVNGSCESDWPQVAELAQRHRQVIPSFGIHPWYVAERTPGWQERLVQFLDRAPGGVGEIGLDRWKPGLAWEHQEEVFAWQFRLAQERDLPVSIHCLQAWGRLHDLLRELPRLRRGFLLHSYGGPQEMVPALAKLGAYFSFPGYFAHERKARQREAFRHIPSERLLIETDAPDQLLPNSLNSHPLKSITGASINHPANLAAVYRFVAEMLGERLETMAERVEENFERLFGSQTLGNRAT